MHVLINIDVDDLVLGVRFYTRVFGLQIGRRFGDAGAELLGLDSPLYLLRKAPGTLAADTLRSRRDYRKHWTPIHLDFVVNDVDATVAAAVDAGATLEGGTQVYRWGRIATLTDPFGHKLGILQFFDQGDDFEAGRRGYGDE